MAARCSTPARPEPYAARGSRAGDVGDRDVSRGGGFFRRAFWGAASSPGMATGADVSRGRDGASSRGNGSLRLLARSPGRRPSPSCFWPTQTKADGVGM